jgi:hypothetical protein
VKRIADRTDQIGRTNLRANDELQRPVTFLLSIRQIPRWPVGSEIESVFFDVLNHSDNGQPREIFLSETAASDSFSDWIFTWPGFARQFLIAEDDNIGVDPKVAQKCPQRNSLNRAPRTQDGRDPVS